MRVGFLGRHLVLPYQYGGPVPCLFRCFSWLRLVCMAGKIVSGSLAVLFRSNFIDQFLEAVSSFDGIIPLEAEFRDVAHFQTFG